MKIKSLLLIAFAGLATSVLAGCQTGGGSTFVDYAHNGSCALTLEYSGHDFFKDGIGEVTLKSAIDGDTAHFYSIEHGQTDILKARFYGIDTPESTGNVQPYGKKHQPLQKENFIMRQNMAQSSFLAHSSLIKLQKLTQQVQDIFP